MAISGMPVIGRHTKLGHGHLLNMWKAPVGPDTLEICQLESEVVRQGLEIDQQ